MYIYADVLRAYKRNQLYCLIKCMTIPKMGQNGNLKGLYNISPPLVYSYFLLFKFFAPKHSEFNLLVNFPPL